TATKKPPDWKWGGRSSLQEPDRRSYEEVWNALDY
ncbi:unnamed protein product, partial [marine sediment metagenome]